MVLLLWVGPEGLVRGFGNEGVVLNEGAVDYSFRPVDSELDEFERDPHVAFSMTQASPRTTSFDTR